MHLTIIGGGRAAWAFGSSWVRAGWIVDGVALRAGSVSRVPELLGVPVVSLEEDLTSEVVLVAVPDDALPSICARAAGRSPEHTCLVHPSGSHDSTIFENRQRAFSLHPLRALPPPGEGEGLAGALLVFEGSDLAERMAREIAGAFGSRFARIPREMKPIYHAAAVLASNLVAAQLDVATDLMRRAGLTSTDMKNEIADLARSAVLNWSDRVGADRFTGPIARGDLALVRSHLAHLASHTSALRIYIAAGLALCRAILEARPDDHRVREIEALLMRGDLP